MHLKPNYYNKALNSLVTLYPVHDGIRVILIAMGIPEGKINLQGAAENMWDSALSYIDKNNFQSALTNMILAKFPNDIAFNEIKHAIENGTAFITKISYENFISNVTTTTAKTFLVYDKKDNEIVGRLKKHLKILQLIKKISVFDMYEDSLGASDKQKFWLENQGSADIILLLLTSNFFDNDDCMPLAFAGFEMGKVIVPVLLSSCLYARIEAFERIVPLPTNGQFVPEYDYEDKALTEIAKGVEQVVNHLKK